MTRVGGHAWHGGCVERGAGGGVQQMGKLTRVTVDFEGVILNLVEDVYLHGVLMSVHIIITIACSLHPPCYPDL